MTFWRIFWMNLRESLALYGLLAFAAVLFVAYSYAASVPYGPEQKVAVAVLLFSMPVLVLLDLILTAIQLRSSEDE